MIKVVKFGGSSVANAGQFKKVKNIVDSDISRKFIVTSACGKSDNEDHKVTDLLYLSHAHIKYGVPFHSLFNIIEEKYKTIKRELNLKIDLDSEFEKIKKSMTKNVSIDYLVSRGEYLAGLCLAEYLNADFIDAKDVILFDYNGKINFERSNEALQTKLNSNKKIVIPGFYGSLPNGKIKIMSRGGSDITGAIIASLVNASIYENWTDVSGILVADPRIVSDPKRIKYITYDELRELSFMGANVLHEETIFPVREKKIPINIKNTNEPENSGTMIVHDCSERDEQKSPGFITGIAGKKDFTVFNCTKINLSSEISLLKKTLEIFEDFNINLEGIQAGIDAINIVVETQKIEEDRYMIISKLKEKIAFEHISVVDNLSLIAVVGRAMSKRPGMSGKLFAELGSNNINIKTISQGIDEINVIVGVDNSDFEKAINCIYDRFIVKGENK
ncbi:MAG: aspartate kinase [Fusobacterium sp.]|uniref:aspartate kinase n=1 Tax=Fusobacterium sp. TaxID=68766 RepID=UPI0026DCC85E|nr:aspartate kinase [Fusobacterium sp.]MDO4689937.1 aspartate kinase [Fusobacterium sp.]